MAKPGSDHRFEVAKVRAGGSQQAGLPLDEKDLFPLIDAFGQFVHKDWPGKIHAVADFSAQKQAEEGPSWPPIPGRGTGISTAAGRPGRISKASGRFRAEKHQGKWWLVDPEGPVVLVARHRLRAGGERHTPITDRRHWFTDLPDKDSPLAAFYGQGNWAPHGYYQGKAYETFNFTAANLFRKYGDQWRQVSAENVHRRLRSWGMNTIGNWSDPAVYLMRKTPYIGHGRFNSRLLEGSEGYWGKFADVFDPSFAAGLRRADGAGEGEGRRRSVVHRLFRRQRTELGR